MSQESSGAAVGSPTSVLRRGVSAAVQIAIALYGLGTIGYLAARAAVGEQWRAVAWANNFVLWMSAAALGMAIAALLFRRRWLLVALQVPMLAAFGVLFGGLLMPHNSGAVAAAAEFRVAAYNMHSQDSDPAQVVQTVLALDADIVGLNEVGYEHADQLEAATKAGYPYQIWYPQPTVHGVALISRYPILDQEMYEPVEPANLHLRVVLDVDGTPVTVFVAHPPSPTSPFFPLGYEDGPRNVELADLRARIEAETGPVMVLCDCNMSDQSDPYRSMDDLLDDSFREAGRGFGLTFPYGRTFLPPLVRIDYIWISGDFTALDAHPAGSNGTSDHRPIIADLALHDAAGS
ncbi:endonuclease/exonuclease/phosphatase family protein [Aggregatilinea lenta]|uniref:endonuclease/exonuclease/phosphatase family protein n=1 Tax=Aggregatilinea lenta TaxID=913108 RepID=UPI000E5C242B|nr:endonuclease/exonuclease/phosphatase family protein [Aggregatilinea lenta]